MATNDNDLVPTDAQLRKALETIQNGIMRDPVRAAALGLIPEKIGTVSERFQFIVNPSNIEEMEDKKKRGFKFREYPKMVHGWPEGEEEPVALIVKNRAEEEKAVAAGWSVAPLHGPAGRLDRLDEPQAEEPEVIRDFAPPGARQPFEEPAEVKPKKAAQAAQPKAKRGRGARKATN